MDRNRIVLLAVTAIICCTIVLAGRNSAQANRGRSRVLWEYSVFQTPKAYARRGMIGKIDEVDRFGQQGWELVSVFEVEDKWIYWFKRSK